MSLVDPEAALAQPLELLASGSRTRRPRGSRSRRPRSPAAARRRARGRAGGACRRPRCAGWRRSARPPRRARSLSSLEGRAREVDLAAHLDQLAARRRSRSGIASIVRRFRVTSSPIRPSPRVAPRTKHAVLVGERDREPVDLRLGRRSGARRRSMSKRLSRLRIRASQAAELLRAAGVAEREHRLGVLVPARTCRAACRRPAGSASRG